MPFRKSWFLSTSLAFAGLILAGCPKAKGPEPVVTAPETAPAAGPTATETVPMTPNVVSVGSDWTAVPGVLQAVRFGYMTWDLSEEARGALKANAVALKALLKGAPGVKVRVEGHCDERGTLEYNMALGQRRANSLQNYYVSLGIPKGAVSTVSYGEERPVCTQSDEECWGQNRRGETTLRSPAGAVQVPLGQ